jgi:hypothetical protein
MHNLKEVRGASAYDISTDSDELTDSRHTKMSYHRDFVPEGCSLAQPAVTLGVRLYIFRKYTGLLIRGHSSHCQAGVQWAEAYEFADAHNITLVGGALVCPSLAVRPQDNNFTAGSDRTVGVVGGWLQVKPYVPDISF